MMHVEDGFQVDGNHLLLVGRTRRHDLGPHAAGRAGADNGRLAHDGVMAAGQCPDQPHDQQPYQDGVARSVHLMPRPETIPLLTGF